MHPVLVSLGPLQIYSYGLMVAIGVGVAVLLVRRNALKINLNLDVAVDIALAMVLLGFIGARLFYVVLYWDYFREAPLEILKIWKGGIVLYGGMMGALVAVFAFSKLRKRPVLELTDLYVPVIAVAQGFGRVGCFLNGCCYGIPANEPWGVQFAHSHISRLPVQMYNSLLLVALFVTLLYVLRRRHWRGQVICLYGLAYGSMRFFMEFLRGDQSHHWGLTPPQWMSLALILLALGLWFRWRPRRTG